MHPQSPKNARIARTIWSVALGCMLTMVMAVIGWEAHARNSGYLTPLWRSKDAMILHNPKPAFAHRQASHRVGASAPEATYSASLEHLPWWAAPSPRGSGANINTAASGWPLPALRTTYDNNNPALRTITRRWGSTNQRREWLVPNQVIWPGFLANSLGFAAGFFPVLTGLSILRTRTRVRRGECRFCRYQRRGLPSDAPCPECGRTPNAHTKMESS